MFNLKFGNKKMTLYAPVKGKLISIEDVADKVFSSKMMGDGAAFVFEGNEVAAPCDGEITLIASTNHAFGITAKNGAEVLVHIGLDTVNLHGKGLQPLLKQGAAVKHGTPVIRIDREFMKENNIDLTTPVVITNSSEFTIEHIASTGDVTIDTEVIDLSK